MTCITGNSIVHFVLHVKIPIVSKHVHGICANFGPVQYILSIVLDVKYFRINISATFQAEVSVFYVT